MTPERFRPSDYRFLAICLALLAVTTWFSVRNFHQAFPEASIEFKVNREGAHEIAARFLAARGYRLDAYRKASRFAYDEETKTFLEREAGLEEANKLMGSRVRLWRWSYRWFRPQQKEEFFADVTPRGEVVAFEHQVPEAEARPGIPPEQARAAAEQFLRSVMGRDPAALEFVEGSTVARPARTDHVFTWKESGFALKDAQNRVEVTVLGAEIGGYREYLKAPEQWQRDYQRLRSKNQTAQSVDSALTMLLVVGMLGSLVLSVRGRRVNWPRAAVVGMIGGGLVLLSSWNEFPLNEFYFPNTDSYGSFAARQLLNGVLGALAAGGLLFILTAAAEPLYREAFPNRVSLGNLFRPRGLRTRGFLLGTVLGISLTGIFVAYQIAFYMAASRLGAWSPADVPYSNILNTRFPWAYVLIGGFLPAVSEEFIFRMFAVPWLRKVFRSLWAALIVAGFLWGFGHSGYPQQPFYIRGLEVGIGGVALGLIMLRWGILPALVWHYSVDAMYTALLLLRSDSLYFQLSGAAAAGIMVLPVAVSLAAYWRNGGFAPETGLTNAGETEASGPGDEAEAEGEAPGAAPGPVPDYRRWSAARRAAALAVLAAGAAALLLPLPRVGESPRYRLAPREALAASGAFLRELGADPAAFRHVVFPSSSWENGDSLAGKYFLERVPVDRAAALFERNRPVQRWTVRYFKALDREEFSVAVHPETGKVMGFGHELPEDRPGADLEPEAARPIAQAFAAARGWDLAAMELKESRSEKRKARRDHTFVWEARPGDPRNLDEARLRLQVEVSGDAVSQLRSFWKLPESFERSRSQQNALSISNSVLKAAVFGVAIVMGLVALIGAIRRGMVRWGAVLRVATPFTLLAALAAALGYPLLWKGYNTAIPIETFQAGMVTGLTLAVISAFLGFTAMVAFVQVREPGSFAVFSRRARAALGVDAVLAALAALGLAALVGAARGLLLNAFHAQALFSVSAPDVIASLAPAASALAVAARSVLVSCAGLALASLLLSQLQDRRLLAAAVAAAVAANVPGSARSAGEFALHFALGLLPLAAVLIFCLVFAKRNLLAYALAAWALALRAGAADLIGQPNPSTQMQGWLVVAVFAATLLWAGLAAGANRSPQPETPSA